MAVAPRINLDARQTADWREHTTSTRLRLRRCAHCHLHGINTTVHQVARLEINCRVRVGCRRRGARAPPGGPVDRPAAAGARLPALPQVVPVAVAAAVPSAQSWLTRHVNNFLQGGAGRHQLIWELKGPGCHARVAHDFDARHRRTTRAKESEEPRLYLALGGEAALDLQRVHDRTAATCRKPGPSQARSHGRAPVCLSSRVGTRGSDPTTFMQARMRRSTRKLASPLLPEKKLAGASNHPAGLSCN
ncbi:Protein of unknown function [Gryllus bimaculatus]|nr:Protein of unknown function [Gryllus bimaculatus]